mgnify:CR=1 FL=1|jgi:hypothetical protein
MFYAIEDIASRNVLPCRSPKMEVVWSVNLMVLLLVIGTILWVGSILREAYLEQKDDATKSE